MTNEFTWKKVSDKERESIKKEAKSIMDSFSGRLDKLKLDKVNEPMIERGDGMREEGEGEKVEIDRKIMFDNAPKKNEDFIIAEKKGW